MYNIFFVTQYSVIGTQLLETETVESKVTKADFTKFTDAELEFYIYLLELAEHEPHEKPKEVVYDELIKEYQNR